MNNKIRYRLKSSPIQLGGIENVHVPYETMERNLNMINELYHIDMIYNINYIKMLHFIRVINGEQLDNIEEYEPEIRNGNLVVSIYNSMMFKENSVLYNIKNELKMFTEKKYNIRRQFDNLLQSNSEDDDIANRETYNIVLINEINMFYGEVSDEPRTMFLFDYLSSVLDNIDDVKLLIYFLQSNPQTLSLQNIDHNQPQTESNPQISKLLNINYNSNHRNCPCLVKNAQIIGEYIPFGTTCDRLCVAYKLLVLSLVNFLKSYPKDLHTLVEYRELLY